MTVRTATLRAVKEFLVYTLFRIALFVGAAAIVYGIWEALADGVPLFWVILIGFVVSGVASYFLLNQQREAFARRVETRAKKASERLEEHRTKEDDE
jgi:hypothetical protein